MSQKYVSGVGNETVVEVNASSVAEVVTLPAWTSTGRKFRIRRTDSGGQSATVAASTGFSIDGVLNATKTLPTNTEVWLELVDPGLWESYGFTAGGGSVDPVALAQDAAFTGTYGPGSTQWLRTQGAGFNFAFTSISASANGLPTAGNVRWDDGTTGTFTGTIDSSGYGYSGWEVTYAGSTTKTVTVSGITYDSSSGNALGPTSVAVA